MIAKHARRLLFAALAVIMAAGCLETCVTFTEPGPDQPRERPDFPPPPHIGRAP